MEKIFRIQAAQNERTLIQRSGFRRKLIQTHLCVPVLCFALPPLRNLQSFFQRNECASKQLSTILFIVALGAGQGGGANRYSS